MLRRRALTLFVLCFLLLPAVAGATPFTFEGVKVLTEADFTQISLGFGCCTHPGSYGVSGSTINAGTTLSSNSSIDNGIDAAVQSATLQISAAGPGGIVRYHASLTDVTGHDGFYTHAETENDLQFIVANGTPYTFSWSVSGSGTSLSSTEIDNYAQHNGGAFTFSEIDIPVHLSWVIFGSVSGVTTGTEDDWTAFFDLGASLGGTGGGSNLQETIDLTWQYGTEEALVPEPATFGLLAFGSIAGLWLRQRRTGTSLPN